MTGSKFKRMTLAGVSAAAAAGGVMVLAGAPHAQAPAAPPAQDGSPGAGVYAQFCGACHNNAEQIRAPGLANMHQLPASQIRFALTEGVMRQQGSMLSAEQKDQVIAWLAAPEAPAAVAAARADATGPSSASPAAHGAAPARPGSAPASTAWTEALKCTADAARIDPNARKTLVMAGVDPTNARHMSAGQAGLTNAQLSQLDVAWTLPFPQTSGLRVTPVIVGTTLFYAVPQPAMLLALDTRTGCIKWAKASDAPYRSSPAYGMAGRRPALFLADQRGDLRAIDPATGDEIWKTDPRHSKDATITGAPMVFGDKLIVPISVLDVARAADPKYNCCSQHGAVSAVDAATGKVLWTAHTMEDAKPLGRKNSAGVEMMGPSGAPVWSTPAIDAKRGLVYAATGENTSPPATKTSDSIMALDIKTGERKWVFQAMERDIWNMSCRGPANSGPNCFFIKNDESVLKDYDFGAGAIIAKRPKGGDVVLAGQKSGHVWALDPDKGGAVLWQKRFGEGTALGGVHWGIASDGRRVFAPISDPGVAAGKSAAGLQALDIGTGEVLWSWAAAPDCENGREAKVSGCKARYGLSAAPMVVDKALVTGSLDGKLRIFETATGKVIWEYDTIREFPARTEGGAKGRGGSIDSQSIAAGDGMVFVGSGYGQFGQQAGNVLIAFKPKAEVRTAKR